MKRKHFTKLSSLSTMFYFWMRRTNRAGSSLNENKAKRRAGGEAPLCQQCRRTFSIYLSTIYLPTVDLFVVYPRPLYLSFVQFSDVYLSAIYSPTLSL